MRNKGLTLVELMMAVGLGGIVILVASGFMRTSTTYFKAIGVRQMLEQESQYTGNMIRAALPKATPMSVVVCSCGVNVCSDTCGASAVGVAPNSRIEFMTTDTHTPMAFYQEGQNLYFRERNGEPKLLANHAQGMMFTGDGQNPYVVSFTLVMTAPGSDGKPVIVLHPNDLVRLHDAGPVLASAISIPPSPPPPLPPPPPPVLPPPPVTPSSCFFLTNDSSCQQTSYTAGSGPNCSMVGGVGSSLVSSCTPTPGASGCGAYMKPGGTTQFDKVCGYGYAPDGSVLSSVTACSTYTGPGCP